LLLFLRYIAYLLLKDYNDPYLFSEQEVKSSLVNLKCFEQQEINSFGKENFEFLFLLKLLLKP